MTATVQDKVISTDALGFAFSSFGSNHSLSDMSEKTTRVERTRSGEALQGKCNHFVQKTQFKCCFHMESNGDRTVIRLVDVQCGYPVMAEVEKVETLWCPMKINKLSIHPGFKQTVCCQLSRTMKIT